MQVLRRAVTDPSAAVRDRTLRGVNALPALWTGKGSTALLLSALADDTASIRRMGLTLASSKAGFWSRPDAQEHLKRLLIDPDAQVRLAALATVEEHGLVRTAPGLARRVKALAADPALKGARPDHPRGPGSQSGRGRARRPPGPSSSPELLDLPAESEPALLSSQ